MSEELKKAYNIAVDIIGHKAVATDEEINAAIASVSLIYKDIDRNAL